MSNAEAADRVLGLFILDIDTRYTKSLSFFRSELTMEEEWALSIKFYATM